LYAVVREGCAPNDGPAWRFALSETPIGCEALTNSEGYFVTLWVTDLEPGAYLLGTAPPIDGTACLCGALGDQAQAGSFRVTAASDAGVTGHIDAFFESGTRRSDTFEAIMCPGTRQCG
jgi:hypothetical protein